MTSVKIKFQSIRDISEFTQIISKENVHAEINSRNITVDAKTFMGIIAMDLSVPLSLMIFETDEIAKPLLSKISQFIYQA